MNYLNKQLLSEIDQIKAENDLNVKKFRENFVKL